MKKYYYSEIEGMIDFYKQIGSGFIVDYDCNTDGRINDCLNEFKLNFTDLSSHKKQVDRYLKAYNSVGKAIPSKALLIDINGRVFIEGRVETFNGYASVIWQEEQRHWSTPSEFIKYFSSEDYCKGWIDENSLISYNNLFCSLINKKTISKDDVRNELINPQTLNIYPFDWYGRIAHEKSVVNDNNWLTFNMNMLGSESIKKRLGAFFTPDRYVKISTDFVRKAIKNVPDGMDYVIIDRCAGTGNLERLLTDDELSHCILNTIDYTEWTTLKGLYDGRVRYIIPHDSKSRDDENGLMSDGDALQKSFYDRILPLIENKYVIMLENPPFAGTAGIRGGASGSLKEKRHPYVNCQMKASGYDGNVCKDLIAQFVWSAFEILKCNEYILYGPVMWWKSNHILDRKYISGHMCNKKDFNASPSGILLGHWVNEECVNNTLVCTTNSGTLYTIKKKKTFITTLLDEYKISIDKNNLRTPDNDELGLLFSTSSTLDALNGGLFNRNTYRTELVTSAGLKMTKLTISNIRKLSVIQCVNCYASSEYYEKDVVMKSADLSFKYEEDDNLLDDCLLFILLSDKTKCTSTPNLQNQLCLSQDTIIENHLRKDNRHVLLFDLWEQVLSELRKCDYPEYNCKYKYGLYQIKKEVNLKTESGSFTKSGKPIMTMKYPLLDEKIQALEEALKDFYNSNIKDKLFEYELLK